MLLLLFIPLSVGLDDSVFTAKQPIKFKVQFDIGQLDLDVNYFVLANESDTCVFFERKKTLYELTLIYDDGHEVYTAPVYGGELIFSWPDKTINGEVMTLALAQTKSTLPYLDTYMFNAPTRQISITPLEDADAVTAPCRGSSCDYYYLIIPFAVCIMGSRLDLFLKLYRNHYTPVLETTV